MERKNQFNSTLHNVSKKRLEEIQNGTYKPKPRTKINPMSKKTRARIKDYREDTFKKWGYRCFLCGRPDPTGKTLDCHHPYSRKNGDDFVIPLCNRFTGCRAHNHSGTDKRFYELQKEIEERL